MESCQGENEFRKMGGFEILWKPVLPLKNLQEILNELKKLLEKYSPEKESGFVKN